jgi:Bax protein
MRKPDFATSSLGLLATAVILLQAAAIFAGPTLPYHPASGGRQGMAAADTAMQAPQAGAAMTAARARHVTALPRVRLFTGAVDAPLPGTVTSVRRSHEARQLFDRAGYDLAAVRAGESDVPRLYLAQVPNDLRQLREVEERKSLFIKTVLPLILRVNEEIAEDRARLLSLDARLKAGAVPGPAELRWLHSLAVTYDLEVTGGDILPDLAALLLRVDEIPVALALAQSIEESGWGTSRFAREGNALYGQYAWRESAGLKPAGSGADTAHVVRSFDRVIDAAAAYSLNLNTHPAYRDFRAARARLRAAGKPLDADALAGHLLRYSERGADYVRTLRIIIRTNRLDELQQASLASGMVVAATETTPSRRGES